MNDLDLHIDMSRFRYIGTFHEEPDPSDPSDDGKRYIFVPGNIILHWPTPKHRKHTPHTYRKWRKR